MYHCLVKTGFPPVYASKNGSLCKSAMYPVFLSNHTIHALSFHAIGFLILLADSKAVVLPSLQPPFHAGLALCSCHMLLSPSPAVLYFLSCFISLLTQCVPCGCSACEKGWLKGMEPGGCPHTWEAFDTREQAQEQRWAVHLQQDGNLGFHGNPLFLLCQNQLSGYLLRKFKNSNGWQKLWVVFTNFCLFFYKTHQVGRCR